MAHVRQTVGADRRSEALTVLIPDRMFSPVDVTRNSHRSGGSTVLKVTILRVDDPLGDGQDPTSAAGNGDVGSVMSDACLRSAAGGPVNGNL